MESSVLKWVACDFVFEGSAKGCRSVTHAKESLERKHRIAASWRHNSMSFYFSKKNQIKFIWIDLHW